jgi:hypothetical protein
VVSEEVGEVLAELDLAVGGRGIPRTEALATSLSAVTHLSPSAAISPGLVLGEKGDEEC